MHAFEDCSVSKCENSIIKLIEMSVKKKDIKFVKNEQTITLFTQQQEKKTI